MRSSRGTRAPSGTVVEGTVDRGKDVRRARRGGLVAFLALILPLTAGAHLALAGTPGDFAQPLTSPEAAGSGPVSVAAADLNGDAKPDLAVANVSSGNVTILLGDGSGNFTAAGTSPEAAGGGPESVAAADLNGDANKDLAVANGASDNVTILLNQGPSANLALSLADSPDPVVAGATLTYTLTASNRGPDDASGVTLTDTLPAGVSFLSASAGCTKSGATVTCSLGGLPDGTTKQRVISVRPAAAGTLTDTASLKGSEADPRPANNQDSEQTTVTASGITCHGHPTTIVGTGNPETLNGTAAADVIASLGGDDTVNALGGNDFLCGGSGDDTLIGGTGNDTLGGGSGDDALDGGLGTDTCNGGSDTDTATGCETVTGVP
jgi:uncharacterized repeat protein (TIGR01451 family)